ncbi:unnamed protein product [Periconia digitata]|uniref:Uncharacterized protein n=1 Tax=Periconia digitata TaxID=1303443 RepID=A0A9W4XRQ1_9PLEO|nr:unnamed protein product [Periconia digitata]
MRSFRICGSSFSRGLGSLITASATAGVRLKSPFAAFSISWLGVEIVSTLTSADAGPTSTCFSVADAVTGLLGSRAFS